MRLALPATTLALALSFIPMLPQLRNNVVYYGRWTPLVADPLQSTQLKLGIAYAKYATGVPPLQIASI